MSDQFSVTTRDLDAHARTVVSVADGVREAGDAGREVRAEDDAYGKLCSFLPPLLGALQDTLTQGITDCAADLDDTVQKLRVTAEHYDSTDAASADAITGSGRVP